jgi:KDO2-lipid IV(A) lauroyltransferase
MSSWSVTIRKKFNRITVVCLVRTFWLISHIMPYRFGVGLGAVLGSLAYAVLQRERNRALAHLKLAFPEKDAAWIRRIARGSFIHLGKCIFEVMLMTPSRMSRMTAAFHGEDNLRKAVAQNKGVIYVSAHIGNWELLGGILATRFPATMVIGIAAPIEPPALNDMIIMLRARMGSQTLLRGKPGAPRELIRVFRENRILGILIDQDTDVDGAFVDFMGKPAWTPTAAASMAIKFGAPMTFGYIQRGIDNRHTVYLEGPLDLISTGDRDRDIIANTAMLTKKIEEVIRRNPEQWVWMHRRWRRQP